MKVVKVARESARAFSDGARVIANYGGTRSGKTYSVVSLLIVLASCSPHVREIDIVSESLPHLKRGAIDDFNKIVASEGVAVEENKTGYVYTFRTGSKIRFFSADDWGKVKGSNRDILFLNECNRIDYEIYRQLAVRTREAIFLDWNPDSEFWFERKGVKDRSTTRIVHSTYKDNPFLGKEQIDEIESNKDDEDWWMVYGLGLVGKPQGVIFPRWSLCNEIPQEARLLGYGLDFGYMNDPTAIVAVYRWHDDIYLHEVAYNKGWTNDVIAKKLKSLAPAVVVADSAEQKSIREIHNFGVAAIEAAVKGADSIRSGIDIMRRFNIHVTADSPNMEYELRNYKWKYNKMTGEYLSEPLDKFNHLIDAARYLITSRLSEKPRWKAQRMTNTSY